MVYITLFTFTIIKNNDKMVDFSIDKEKIYNLLLNIRLYLSLDFIIIFDTVSNTFKHGCIYRAYARNKC